MFLLALRTKAASDVATCALLRDVSWAWLRGGMLLGQVVSVAEEKANPAL